MRREARRFGSGRASSGEATHKSAPSRRNRIAVDWFRAFYLVLILLQASTISLHEIDRLSGGVALVVAFITSVGGSLLGFLVSLHVFRYPHHRKALDIFNVAVTYVVTCTSFAIIYAVIAKHEPRAFNLPANSPGLDFGSALYFSIVTITTTGYGDISPASALARLAACWEIASGLLYQVFVFSLVASLITLPRRGAEDRPEDDGES